MSRTLFPYHHQSLRHHPARQRPIPLLHLLQDRLLLEGT